MSGAYERQAARVILPTSTLSDTFPAAGVNTGGLDLTEGNENAFVWLKATESCSIRAGATASVAATAGDIPLEADTDYSFYVTKATRYISVRGTGTGGTLYVAKSS